MKKITLFVFILFCFSFVLVSCHCKKSAGTSSTAQQSETVYYEPVNVSALRYSSAELISGNDYTITVKINKGNLHGFARYADVLPEGASASEVDSHGGTFSFNDHQMKIVWDNMPSDSIITLSYKIRVSGNTFGSEKLDGKFSYVENSDPKKINVESALSSDIKKDFEKEGYVKASVIFYEVSGCEYILKLEDGKKLEPVNLALSFKKDMLPVWIKYIPKKEAVSICMAGQIVELIDVQARKE